MEQMYRTAGSDDLTGAVDAEHPWTNRLVHADSLYLRRHGHDPVDWRPWGEEAFAEARDLDRPIFLSIGYASCHWCHVMQRESFADPAVAARLNEQFVPIKVDRDERPDVDALYVQALLEIQGQAGWPATLFLFPDLRPFTGATYLPKEPAYGLPGLREVLETVQGLWQTERDGLTGAGDAVRKALLGAPSGEAPLAPDAWQEAVAALVGLHDTLHGGFGDERKFPQTCENELLLLAAAQGHEPASRAVRRNLDEMARRGLQDHLSGGFHRYCTDRAWSRPHFEKMLVDNAELVRLYARASRLYAGGGRIAAQASRRDVGVVRDAVRWMRHELAHPDGGLCASLGAGPHDGEGGYYALSAAEVRAVVGEGDLPYGIRADGTPSLPSALGGLPPRPVREALRELRARRPAPLRDDARIVAFNGLAVAALAEAGRLLGFDDWVAWAAHIAERLLDARLPDGRLPRRLGSDAPGVLADHAHVAEGLLALYQARPGELRWLSEALALTRATVEAFAAHTGGFLDSVAPELPVPRRTFVDEAGPSGNARMAEVLRALLAYGAPLDPSLLDRLLAAAAPTMAELPAATPELHAVLRARTASAEHAPPVLVIAGRADDPVAVRMLRAWDRTWRPQGLVAVTDGSPTGFAHLDDKVPGPDGAPRAWLCRGGTCAAPVDSDEALEALLDGA